jgi:Zn ribbon nucleic-acid-binding protein
MSATNYMGIFVEDDVEEKSCQTCTYVNEIDRHECNVCAHEWQSSNMMNYVGWKQLQA